MKLILTISLDSGTTRLGAESLRDELIDWLKDEYDQDINSVQGMIVENGATIEVVRPETVKN